MWQKSLWNRILTDASFWCIHFRRHHSLRTSLCQFLSSRFPDACVGPCYDNSLPFNGGLTGAPTSSQMVPAKNSRWFVFLMRTQTCIFLWLLCKEFYNHCTRPLSGLSYMELQLPSPNQMLLYKKSVCLFETWADASYGRRQFFKLGWKLGVFNVSQRQGSKWKPYLRSQNYSNFYLPFYNPDAPQLLPTILLQNFNFCHSWERYL